MHREVRVSPTLVLPLTRLWFLLDVLLVAVAGLQLYLLSTRTADFFAWTIRAPLTAAFMGAGYWASLPYLFLALRMREWQRVRLLVVLTFVVAVFMLFITLRDLGSFHLNTGAASARGAAWAWLAIYIVTPWVVLAVFLLQERAGGAREYAVLQPLLLWVRILFLLQAAVFTVLGLGLMLTPARFDDVWPWPVPRLPAGAVGAWLLAIAAGAWWVLREGDW